MTTRRDFLKQGAAASLADMLPIVNMPDIGAWSTASDDSGLLYAGKPMSYWVSRINCCDYDPEFEELDGDPGLRHFGPSAAPYLIEALGEKDNFGAIWQLELVASARTIRILIESLKHDRPNIRAGAVDALAVIALAPPPVPQVAEALKESLPAIAGLLQDADVHVVAKAEYFLCDQASEIDPSFPMPVCGLEDARAVTRRNAVRRLGKLAPETAVPLLVAKLDDPESTVRWAVAEQLSKFDPDHPVIVPLFIDCLLRRREIGGVEFSHLDRIVPKALTSLCEALKSGGPKVRVSILHEMGKCNSESVLPTLLERLSDDDAEVRKQAISSFCDEDPPSLARKALPGLMELLESGTPLKRVSAALVIAALDGEGKPALSPLRSNLRHPDSSVQLAAAIALAHIQPNGHGLLPILFAGLEHPDPELRNFAWRTLRMVNCEELQAELTNFLPELIDGLQHPAKRTVSAWLLSQLGPGAAAAVPGFMALLSTRDLRDHLLRRFVPKALARIGPMAIPPLVQLMEHREAYVRIRAMKALGETGGRAVSAAPQLVERLTKGNPVERMVAARALGEIGPVAASLALPALKALIEDRDLAIRNATVAAIGRMAAVKSSIALA